MQDRFSSVTGDGDIAAQRATEHLIETGSRRIAFIGGPNHLDMVQRRKHGYLEALREHRLPIDRDIICCDLIDKERVRQTVVALLRSDNRPDAILAFNDIIMYAVFETVKELGLRIPEDVAIIGFSDSETSRLVTPKLSVIQDQAHLQGERACDLLLRQINGDTEIVHEQIPMLLQIRESSAKK
jgi:LacI family transcriptional regulator